MPRKRKPPVAPVENPESAAEAVDSQQSASDTLSVPQMDTVSAKAAELAKAYHEADAEFQACKSACADAKTRLEACVKRIVGYICGLAAPLPLFEQAPDSGSQFGISEVFPEWFLSEPASSLSRQCPINKLVGPTLAQGVLDAAGARTLGELLSYMKDRNTTFNEFLENAQAEALKRGLKAYWETCRDKLSA